MSFQGSRASFKIYIFCSTDFEYAQQLIEQPSARHTYTSGSMYIFGLATCENLWISHVGWLAARGANPAHASRTTVRKRESESEREGERVRVVWPKCGNIHCVSHCSLCAKQQRKYYDFHIKAKQLISLQVLHNYEKGRAASGCGRDDEGWAV